jgi:hypothetical protein
VQVQGVRYGRLRHHRVARGAWTAACGTQYGHPDYNWVLPAPAPSSQHQHGPCAPAPEGRRAGSGSGCGCGGYYGTTSDYIHATARALLRLWLRHGWAAPIASTSTGGCCRAAAAE